MNYDAIILGAGAAGLMCAAKAGQRGRRILLIEHADAPGKKILISGGGRCNFTNIGTSADQFISKNRHFAKSALTRYTPDDFVALVDAHHIGWHEKTLGQLFCDGSSRAIVDMLQSECPQSVTLSLGRPIDDVGHHDGMFSVTVGGTEQTAKSLVIACGGPSIPKMGATGFAYDLARRFGLKVVEPRPALVPLTLGEGEILFRELSGVATPTRVRCGKTMFDEASLFTHRGLSGPAILQISTYWHSGATVEIDFLPGQDAQAILLSAKAEHPRASLRSTLSGHLPTRLADALTDRIGLPGNLADIPNRDLIAAGSRLANWQFRPSGTEGFAKAEVTSGGIDTAFLNQTTMAANQIPGLYAIGEAVDVTGWLGGYNFQWAWASGAAAGEAI